MAGKQIGLARGIVIRTRLCLTTSPPPFHPLLPHVGVNPGGGDALVAEQGLDVHPFRPGVERVRRVIMIQFMWEIFFSMPVCFSIPRRSAPAASPRPAAVRSPARRGGGGSGGVPAGPWPPRRLGPTVRQLPYREGIGKPPPVSVTKVSFVSSNAFACCASSTPP